MKNDSDNPASDRACDPLDKLLRSALWPDHDADPLDDLLHMAQWPEPTADALARWRQRMARWQARPVADLVCVRPQGERISALQRKKAPAAWTVAGSAAVAVFLLGLVLWNMRPSGDRSAADVPTQVSQDLAPNAPVSDETPIRRDSPPTDAREAFAEAVVSQDIVAVTNAPAVAQAIPPGELYLRMLRARRQTWRLPEGEDSIDRILVQRIAEPDGDLQELVQPLLAERAECEQRLLERFHTFDDEQASAAVEVLGCIGSEASVPLVLQWSCRPARHAPAVRALLRIADTRMLARLALNEWDPELQEEITAALRARGDEQTLVFVLAVQGEYSCLEPGLDLW